VDSPPGVRRRGSGGEPRLYASHRALLAFSGLVTADMLLPPRSGPPRDLSSPTPEPQSSLGPDSRTSEPTAAAAAAGGALRPGAQVLSPAQDPHPLSPPPAAAAAAPPLAAPTCAQPLPRCPPACPRPRALPSCGRRAPLPRGVRAAAAAALRCAPRLLAPGPLEALLRLAAAPLPHAPPPPCGADSGPPSAAAGGRRPSLFCSAADGRARAQRAAAAAGEPGSWTRSSWTPPCAAFAPPLDSIRPGRSFGLPRLPWFAATAYPWRCPSPTRLAPLAGPQSPRGPRGGRGRDDAAGPLRAGRAARGRRPGPLLPRAGGCG